MDFTSPPPPPEKKRPTALERRLKQLMYFAKPPVEELQALNGTEQEVFIKLVSEKLEELNTEHTRLLQLIGAAAQLPVNQLTWENNHLKITKAIHSALCKTGQMPNQLYLSEVTGLSRKTINEHLASGDDSSVYTEHMRQFSMMAPRVMDKVLKSALEWGNTQSIKIYFELLEKMKGSNSHALYNTQNNYIQINHTILKQEAIQKLSPEQLKQIEEIVQRNLPVVDAEVEVEKKE